MSKAASLLSALVMALASCAGEKENFGKRPDWSVTGLDGKKVSASDYDKKVVIVDFWATWCPPCRKEIPGFIELQKKYKDKGLEIIGFSLDNDKDTHDRWIRENNLNYLSIFAQTEEGRNVVSEFGKVIGEIQGLPTTIVIDRSGKIVHKHVGYGSPEDFEKVITPLF